MTTLICAHTASSHHSTRFRKSFTTLAAVIILLSTFSWETARADEPKPQVSDSAHADAHELYLGLYMLGTLPRNRALTMDGSASGSFSFEQTDVKGSLGGGLKAGIFPTFGNGYLGFELDVFGHGGTVSSPPGISPLVGPHQASGNLTVVNGMVNILLRYPGHIIQPYIGVGTGVSFGTLSSAGISVGPTTLSDAGSDAALAYQFLGGVRGMITNRVFLFTEYKYFVANYEWDSVSLSGNHPRTSLQFRSHIVAGGVGISF